MILPSLPLACFLSCDLLLGNGVSGAIPQVYFEFEPKHKQDHIWLESRQGFQNWSLVAKRALFPPAGPGRVKLGCLGGL